MRDAPLVKGNQVDTETRCAHYHSEVDVIAIRFYCCGEYYACYSCHQEEAGHEPQRWPKSSWEERAILCGSCDHELTIDEYMKSSQCPVCQHGFNEGCQLHYPLYFDM
ncbi:hypothetical protein GLW00_11320 [Halobacillus litoralis]|uniref:CHY-type domain-containing protein n=1 Tax=Halobacillus litoralis TaxID=45668 RepID=A0A845FC48_9BACI|nr:MULTISPECIES: CHY zinc finger protein [Halobacillus]MEC3885598.1 CHY zinc finger protein [Halobacillus sp. HZG1]MYL71449.1 hypothetical protein [Halobacillus litoralis]